MSSKNLRLNFAPVGLRGDTEIHVGFRPFEVDTLASLRKEYGETHVFRTHREDDTIIDIPVAQGAEPLSDKTMEVDLKETHWYWAALLNAALVRAFSGKREIARDYPVEVLGSAQRNLIGHEKLPNWVQKRSLLQFTPRTIFGSDGKPQFGLLCDARVRNLLLATCDELIDAGISVIGKYVIVDHPPDDPRLTPRPQTVGRVASISDGQLLLEDHREGFESVDTSRARLSASKVDFDWCVRSLLGNDAERVLNDAKLAASQLHSGPGRLKTIEETLGFLRDQALEAVPGVEFEMSELLDSKSPVFPAQELIQKPSLVFDPSGTRTDNWNERGIKANGPYDQRTFTPKKLNIAVICQARYEGQVETFVAKFLEGMPDVKTGRRGREQARYGDGFLRRFQLEKANVQTFTSKSATLDGYEQACSAALAHSADTGIQWDLALVQVEEDFKALPGHQNPYFGTKAALLKNHVAVQSFRLETMNQPASGLVFTMNQMSLACYAKLGGRPWLLGAEQTVGHELVIGVGSHVATTSRIGGGSRQVGITTVFSSDGGYHLSERTNVVPFSEYASALTETLKRTITRIRDQDNWKNTDRVRLIFHMFKPAKDVEAEAIKAAVEGLELDNVTYAFVHIAPTNPFVLFDMDQKGEPPWSQQKKGVLGPSRGMHLKLGDHESLVVFAGASELKQATDGMPRACLLKLHRNSTFRDMTYLARQAFDFTAHSWRIMSPEPFPITIKYSDLIAERLTGLKQIKSWDDDAVKFRDIGRTLWFL
ncbi:MAG: hypothetical protein JJ920_08120 [Roseitalea sp.]|nr:hypothetical protein [Roseitalea sp.]MBO6721065.1 hypothetical protein [Roseitalea sp.]MBO6742863.1 hypothetical protein [Roseitalea sp.]